MGTQLFARLAKVSRTTRRVNKAGTAFHEATIVQKGGDLGYTLHSAARKVTEDRAVGHSSGWEQDEKNWRRAAIMAYQKREVGRLERWAIRTAEEMLDAHWQGVLELCELIVEKETIRPSDLSSQAMKRKRGKKRKREKKKKTRKKRMKKRMKKRRKRSRKMANKWLMF
ncbi:hypothetical protein niasHS_004544 [Heterodera schachtii]|uniref:Uncharacterized protein n=1 Tax=Heterodera schachtii TaxID=97005 RepID=A0ABD2JML0_HETSC